LETTLRIYRSLVLVILLSLVAGPRAASAQSYDADARKIGMGGVSDNSNIAASMVDAAQPYSVILLPFGLLQVLKDFDKFDPSGDQFDPARAAENASNPLHFTTGRGSSDAEHPEARFMSDLVNGRLNRDLSTYRGFHLPSTISAEGLASGGFGKIIKFAKKADGGFQGVYVGAGPYLAFDTGLGVDPKLSDIFGSDTPKYYPNSAIQVTDTAAIQLAMSINVGYRARLAFPGTTAAGDTARDGIYLAMNYRYLKGFKYLEPDTTVRFDTDGQGLLTINPNTAPLTVDDLEASSGHGRAVDVGMQVVRNNWQAGVGVNGIGNQITWTDLTQKRFTLTSLVQGSDFVETAVPSPLDKAVVKLPVVTSGNFGVDVGGWTFTTNAARGFNGKSFHGGAERRLGVFALRGGARYSRGRWDPTYGFGVGRKVALDVAFFGTHSNLQDKRETSIAASIRINHSR
jgi:hypothetical protein